MLSLNLSLKYRNHSAITSLMAKWKESDYMSMKALWNYLFVSPNLQHTKTLLALLSVDRPTAGALLNRW